MHEVYGTAKDFHWTKVLPNQLPSIMLHHGMNFRPCGNSLYIIISTILKDCGIRVLPTRAGGEKDKNFLQVNIFGYLIFN